MLVDWHVQKGLGFKLIILEELEKEYLCERENYWMKKTRCFNPEYGYHSHTKTGKRDIIVNDTLENIEE